MSGKAKPQKHTAKEIAQKHHEAKMRAGGRGGGEEGKEKRKAPKEGKMTSIFCNMWKIYRRRTRSLGNRLRETIYQNFQCDL